MTGDLSATRHDRPPPLSRLDGAWFLFPLTAWLVRILSKQIRQGETGETRRAFPSSIPVTTPAVSHPFISLQSDRELILGQPRPASAAVAAQRTPPHCASKLARDS